MIIIIITYTYMIFSQCLKKMVGQIRISASIESVESLLHRLMGGVALQRRSGMGKLEVPSKDDATRATFGGRERRCGWKGGSTAGSSTGNLGRKGYPVVGQKITMVINYVSIHWEPILQVGRKGCPLKKQKSQICHTSNVFLPVPFVKLMLLCLRDRCSIPEPLTHCSSFRMESGHPGCLNCSSLSTSQFLFNSFTFR